MRTLSYGKIRENGSIIKVQNIDTAFCVDTDKHADRKYALYTIRSKLIVQIYRNIILDELNN